MKGLAVAAVAFAMLGIAACGGSDSDSGGGSAEDQVTESVAAFSDAIANEDYGAACDMYAADSVEFFESQNQIPGGCEGLIEGTYGSLSDDAIEGIEADTIEIEGDRANVQLVNGDTLVLQDQDGEWMITLD